MNKKKKIISELTCARIYEFETAKLINFLHKYLINITSQQFANIRNFVYWIIELNFLVKLFSKKYYISLFLN